ncbi:hypothetical protein OSG_eHP1_00135 [environmental Halophage eHP-1]|nr:hypothetical protein OSG_eHP1_00135 [environmental Halophage eHP-1]
MVDFTVRRDGTVEDAVYDVDPLSDTANPFGDFCVVKIDDRGGNKFDKYSRGTSLEVSIDAGDVADLSIATGETITTSAGTTDTYRTVSNAGTYRNQGTVTSQAGGIDRFDGYVVETRETEQSGADVLEVEAYTFDQFLRRNTVSTDQTGNTIAEALESIVKNDTPVSYVASNIEVVNDQELTRSYRGEPVEVVLRDLAFKSGNEAFGVNDSREFFFRPRETKHIDRGIDNTQWFRYDIPELGKDAINEVEVFFNDGNESVIIDAPTDKLELQDGLSLPEPGTQREELNRPLVTDIQDAEDIGRQYLQFRNATLSGTVTTFGLYDAEPGDTINITIESRGIDTEFRIAAVEYRWGRDETILTVVERRGDQDKILSRISESVKRQEMETADRDAPSNRITTTEANAIIDVSVDADGNTPDDTRFVNPGRNAVRDAWSDDGTPDISTIAIGTNGSGLSRSNTELNNQVTTVSATESLPTNTSAEYSASITQTGVEEIGLTTSGGTLIARAVFDAPVDLGGTVSVTLDVSNDSDVQRGVLTNDGQTAVRDVLADNSPNLPTDYAYGSEGSAVSVSDTSLGNKLKQVSLSEILVQDADTDSEWSSITTIDSTKPIEVNNSKLNLLQSSFVIEAEAADLNNGSTGIQRSDFSSDPNTTNDGQQINDYGEAPQYDINIPYEIPASEFSCYIRGVETVANDTTALIVTDDNNNQLSGQTLAFDNTVKWIKLSLDGGDGPPSYLNQNSFQLKPNPALNGIDTWGELQLDVVAFVDERYTTKTASDFDNTDLSTVSRDYLNNPELYPNIATQTLSKSTTRRNISEGSFDGTWNDTTNNQFVEISPDGSKYTRFDNTSNGSYSFSNPTQKIDVNLGLSRFPVSTNPQNATPRFGYNGQSVDLWELFVNPNTPSPDDIGVTNARAIVPTNTSGITGNTVREAGLKSGSTLLTHHQLAEFVLETDQRLASSETNRFKGTE